MANKVIPRFFQKELQRPRQKKINHPRKKRLAFRTNRQVSTGYYSGRTFDPDRIDNPDNVIMLRGDYVTKKQMILGDIPVMLGGQEPMSISVT